MRSGFTLARLNLVLAAILVTAVAAPPVIRWYQAWSRAESAPATASVPASGGPAAERPTLPGPEAPEPTASLAPAAGPEVALGQEAVRLYQEGRVAEACERFREAAGRAPGEATRANAARCSGRLGREAYQAGRPAEAVRHYAQAVELDPGTREWWHALAIAHLRAGEASRAQAVLQDALGRFPGDGDTAYLLAEAQERQGRTRDAVETLRRLLTVQPGHARAQTLLASLEREQKVEGAYWSQESAHFLVRYEGAGGIEVGRSVADFLEQAYESIGRDLGVYPTERVQVGIYVTPTFAALGGIPPEFAEHVLGFYDRQKLRLRLSASVAHSIPLERLVRHEYTHLVIHRATNGRAPRWLHEGLAQVMEPRAAPRFIEMMGFALDRQAVTLDGLERLFRSNAVGVAYQLSHVVVEHLVDRGGLTGMQAFLGRLGQGEGLAQALDGAFRLGVTDVEARLRAAAGRS